MSGMSVHEMIVRQYAAALEMLKEACRLCPDETWTGSSEKFSFWRVAYHALFFTHLYASDSIEEFSKWQKHREGAESLKLESDDSVRPNEIQPVYSQDELQEYCVYVTGTLADCIPRQAMHGPSGIPWWEEFDKLEMHVYNIRHLQHHVGQLVDRLRNSASVEVDWVGHA